MNNTYWNNIENQIKNLSIIDRQIEKVRTLLAEDWRIRTSAGNVSDFPLTVSHPYIPN